MRNVLEEFAYGNISPETQSFRRESEYGQIMALVSRNEEQLLKRLNEAEKEILKKYTDAQMELNQLTAVKNLVYGYKLGVVMTAEAFVTGGDLIMGG